MKTEKSFSLKKNTKTPCIDYDQDDWYMAVRCKAGERSAWLHGLRGRGLSSQVWVVCITTRFSTITESRLQWWISVVLVEKCGCVCAGGCVGWGWGGVCVGGGVKTGMFSHGLMTNVVLVNGILFYAMEFCPACLLIKVLWLIIRLWRMSRKI